MFPTRQNKHNSEIIVQDYTLLYYIYMYVHCTEWSQFNFTKMLKLFIFNNHKYYVINNIILLYYNCIYIILYNSMYKY